MLIQKLKAMNPICKIVNEHRALCHDVVEEGQKVLQRRADETMAAMPWNKPRNLHAAK